MRGYRAENPAEKEKRIDRIIGIDGEGQGRRPHLFTYLAASDASGEEVYEVEDREGLSTEACLDLILGIPERCLVMSYAFQYDLAKILKDVPDKKLYRIFHEETRARIVRGRVVYDPEEWNGYQIDYLNRRFSVQKKKKRIVVWDIFRFFQERFVETLKKWKIGTPEELAEMQAMKEKRSEFDKQDFDSIKRYCQSECRKLATLARALIDVHIDADLELQSYFGAGSTSTVLLKKMNVQEYRGEIPEEMRHPIACGFFGGRFENSFTGAFRRRVRNNDISSAYPYHATFLPCLACGSWKRVTGKRLDREIERADLALIHWTSDAIPIGDRAWGAFPVRAPSVKHEGHQVGGSIMFPIGGAGGWTWKAEWLAGRDMNPSYRATEAWVYRTDCDHKPFAEMPIYYLARLALGKEARGQPFKLGPNGVYGKLAQSVGVEPPFQSWIWASNITSGCRAQLLEAVKLAADPWDVLMLATDGVWSKTELSLPPPRDTGTSKPGPPLGGWEEKIIDNGVFCVRPGIYFPLNPTEKQTKEVRARGLGKKILYEQWRNIVQAWDRGEKKIIVSGLERFVGAKSALTRDSKKRVTRSPDYGEWISHEVEVSFSPFPKRRRIMSDGRLEPWAYLGWESEPYDPALESPEAKLLSIAEMIAEEQPDLTFGDVE